MRYTSKQVQIARDDETIFRTLSNFDNFSPMLADKVEAWESSGDRCRFRAKGMPICLKMDQLEPCTLIKVSPDLDAGGVPIPFTFWTQLKNADRDDDGANDPVPDTRMQIVLEIELNPMLKVLVGNKMQDAVDTIADQIAAAFNNTNI